MSHSEIPEEHKEAFNYFHYAVETGNSVIIRCTDMLTNQEVTAYAIYKENGDNIDLCPIGIVLGVDEAMLRLQPPEGAEVAKEIGNA